MAFKYRDEIVTGVLVTTLAAGVIGLVMAVFANRTSIQLFEVRSTERQRQADARDERMAAQIEQMIELVSEVGEHTQALNSVLISMHSYEARVDRLIAEQAALGEVLSHVALNSKAVGELRAQVHALFNRGRSEGRSP